MAATYVQSYISGTKIIEIVSISNHIMQCFTNARIQLFTKNTDLYLQLLVLHYLKSTDLYFKNKIKYNHTLKYTLT